MLNSEIYFHNFSFSFFQNKDSTGCHSEIIILYNKNNSIHEIKIEVPQELTKGNVTHVLGTI
jgi:CTP:phosphocholine cytidylyltransferase-like protein